MYTERASLNFANKLPQVLAREDTLWCVGKSRPEAVEVGHLPIIAVMTVGKKSHGIKEAEFVQSVLLASSIHEDWGQS